MNALVDVAIAWSTFVIFLTLPRENSGLLSDYKICGGSGCESPLSRVHAIVDHRGKDCRFLNFQRGEIITVYQKLTGTRDDLWAGSINQNFGYFPKEAVKEDHIYTTEEKVFETQKSDFFCMNEFGYPLDTSHLDTESNGEKFINQESNSAGSQIDATEHPSEEPTATTTLPESEPDGNVAIEKQSLEDLDEQGGLESSSWMSPSTWLGFTTEEQPEDQETSDNVAENQAQNSVSSSSEEDKLGDTESLASTVSGWIGFGGNDEKIGEDNEGEASFRSRKMNLDLEGGQLQEDMGTFAWLGDGISSTLGLGGNNPEPTVAVNKESNERETEQRSSSWFDLGIKDMLPFGKDESVDAETTSEETLEDKHLTSNAEPVDTNTGSVESFSEVVYRLQGQQDVTNQDDKVAQEVVSELEKSVKQNQSAGLDDQTGDDAESEAIDHQDDTGGIDGSEKMNLRKEDDDTEAMFSSDPSITQYVDGNMVGVESSTQGEDSEKEDDSKETDVNLGADETPNQTEEKDEQALQEVHEVTMDDKEIEVKEVQEEELHVESIEESSVDSREDEKSELKAEEQQMQDDGEVDYVEITESSKYDEDVVKKEEEDQEMIQKEIHLEMVQPKTDIKDIKTEKDNVELNPESQEVEIDVDAEVAEEVETLGNEDEQEQTGEEEEQIGMVDEENEEKPELNAVELQIQEENMVNNLKIIYEYSEVKISDAGKEVEKLGNKDEDKIIEEEKEEEDTNQEEPQEETDKEEDQEEQREKDEHQAVTQEWSEDKNKQELPREEEQVEKPIVKADTVLENEEIEEEGGGATESADVVLKNVEEIEEKENRLDAQVQIQDDEEEVENQEVGEEQKETEEREEMPGNIEEEKSDIETEDKVLKEENNEEAEGDEENLKEEKQGIHQIVSEEEMKRERNQEVLRGQEEKREERLAAKEDMTSENRGIREQLVNGEKEQDEQEIKEVEKQEQQQLKDNDFLEATIKEEEILMEKGDEQMKDKKWEIEEAVEEKGIDQMERIREEVKQQELVVEDDEKLEKEEEETEEENVKEDEEEMVEEEKQMEAAATEQEDLKELKEEVIGREELKDVQNETHLDGTETAEEEKDGSELEEKEENHDEEHQDDPQTDPTSDIGGDEMEMGGSGETKMAGETEGALGLFKNAFSYFGSSPATQMNQPPEPGLGLEDPDQKKEPKPDPTSQTPPAPRSPPPEMERVNKALLKQYRSLVAHVGLDHMNVLMDLFGQTKLQFLDFIVGQSEDAIDENDKSILLDIETLLQYHKKGLATPGEDKTRVALQKLQIVLDRVRETFGTRTDFEKETQQDSCDGLRCQSNIKTEKHSIDEKSKMEKDGLLGEENEEAERQKDNMPNTGSVSLIESVEGFAEHFVDLIVHTSARVQEAGEFYLKVINNNNKTLHIMNFKKRY